MKLVGVSKLGHTTLVLIYCKYAFPVIISSLLGKNIKLGRGKVISRLLERISSGEVGNGS